MNPARLEDWLRHLEQLHPKTIELSLDRVHELRRRLRLEPACPVIMVGGTNGKGSTCAMLEAMLLAGGYRVGLYTSPHLLRYNERVRIDGRMADDDTLCAGFAAVEAARGSLTLTYFEFGTLAAMWQFQQERLDAIILEVGLGGRLDAVNAFEPDVSLILTIDLDHAEYLGDTREKIGYEKAGIYRASKPAICADTRPPRSLTDRITDISAMGYLMGRDFGYTCQPESWSYWGPHGSRHALPYPPMRGQHQLANAAAALMALRCLEDRLPLSQAQLRGGLLSARLPGRFQVMPGKPVVILDVAHNPQSARSLAQNLREQPTIGCTIAVFGMLKDKDIGAVIAALKPCFSRWHVASLGGPRGAQAVDLAHLLRQAEITDVTQHPDVAQAYATACREAGENDRICVFGSFHTVAEALMARGAKE